MDAFHPSTASWFAENFEQPTEVQRLGWERIARGDHALLAAPTGSGKTLAAFLWGIDQLTRLPLDAPGGVRLVYVSPLKALVYDIERNLRAPLAGVLRHAERSGRRVRPIRVDVRTGDTPQRERQRQARDPAEILVTTPESLFLILGSRAREGLRTTTTVIVDEIHAIAPSKRGTHLALSLERLALLCEQDPQRIGLSATVRPLDDVARFLGGDRAVEVVDTTQPPQLDLRISVPVPDMENVPPPAPKEDEGGPILGKLYHHQVGAPMAERGIWPAVYPELLREIRAHRSTILFVNNRGLCERLAQRLNDLAEEELVLSHHGSVSHERRALIENALKEGRLRGIVATSSLELGIDMGAVDHVILVESPGSVARGLQRIGRAGHQVGATSSGTIYPKFRADLLECAVVAERMGEGAIEAIQVPSNALDVLAQQLVAMCCDQDREVAELERVVRRAHPYRELSHDALIATLDMLAGRYPSTDFADLRPRLRWDRANDVLSARKGTPMVSRMNAGTIPDRGLYGVHLVQGDGESGPRVGELDEEMVFESREGDTFLLGATTWRVESITRDRVLVSPAPGEPGRLPFWHGDGPGRPIELGQALGKFTREVGDAGREGALELVRERLPLDEHAAENLVAYVHQQKEQTGVLPTDRAITIERFRDELGDWRVCILTPFGSRVHAPWAMALEQRLSRASGIEVQLMYSDDGIVLRMADTEELPELDLLLPDPDEVEELVTEQLGSTSLFAALFRENSVRSLLVTRRRPDQRSPLWAQRRKARELLATVQPYPSFPIVLETYRHALSEVFDLRGLRELLGRIQRREVRVDSVETRSASPFARSLVFAYVAAYLYDGDSPLAERKAQALTLDRTLLAELLGQAELRELLDADAIDEVEAELQGLADERRARDRDELHDVLRRVGDLTREELAARATDDCAPWLATLFDERRAIELTILDERRWIAAEDAGLYRDALGCVPPGGLPDGFLDPVDKPLTRLVRRFARTHGPFTTGELQARYGASPESLVHVLQELERDGALVRGELRPGGVEPEWCDAEVLRRIKRRTLAKLRNEVAAVDGATFARFLARWHGLDGKAGSGPARLEEIVSQLEGLALPWSVLSQDVLPRRMPGVTLDELDMLAATGRVVWIGHGPLGPSDGRVALYRREQLAELVDARDPDEPDPESWSELHTTLLSTLRTRGASFLFELEHVVREAHPGALIDVFEAAVWDLVWAGRITNDTFQPLRSLKGGGARRSRSSRSARNAPGLAGGRWSLVDDLLAQAETSDTERAVARAGMLLERYGIVSREAAQHEGLPRGFGAVYGVLRTMEDTGRARRGYFVEGLSGAQFGLPGSIDRLRDKRETAREPELIELAAQDPAQPYGALLEWPETMGSEDQRRSGPRRVPKAHVILADGRPVLYVAPSRRHVLTFTRDDELLGRAFRLLHDLPRRGRRSLVLHTVDGEPVGESTHRETLLAAGFVPDYNGFIPDPGGARRA